MRFPKSNKQKLLLAGVTLVLLVLTGLAIARKRPAPPLTEADQKYRQVIERCIREGKREFSADTDVRVQIIVQAAQQAGCAVTTDKLDRGARVHLTGP